MMMQFFIVTISIGKLVRWVLGRKRIIMAAFDVVIAGSEYLVERARLAGARRIENYLRWLIFIVTLHCPFGGLRMF